MGNDVQRFGAEFVSDAGGPRFAGENQKGVASLDNLERKAGETAGAVDSLAGALDGAGVAAATASGGADIFAESVESILAKNPAMVRKLAELKGEIAGVGEAAGASVPAVDALAASVDAEAAAAERAAAASEMFRKAEEQRKLQMAASMVSQAAAEAQLGGFYKTYSKLEKMGTPALMKAGTWAGIGVAGGIYEGIKMFTTLQSKMTQLSTQAGIDKNWLPSLTQDALKISKETGQSVNDIADAMYRVASGTASWRDGLGATKSQLVGITDAVSQLNLLGNVPSGQQAEQASRILTVMLNANFKGIGKDPKKAMALINAGVGAGDIRMSELISALGRGALSSAAGVGLSAKDTIAWIDLLTSMGTTGSVAGTYVRSGIINLAAAGGKGEKALAMLGIKPGEIQALMSGPTGLTGAAQFLNEHLNKWNPLMTYPKFKGMTGRAAAEAQLQAWGANSLDPKLIKKWGMNSTGALATDMTNQTLTDKEKQFLKIFMLANAFGGAKQLTPILTLLQATDIPGQQAGRSDTIQGIRASIDRNATQKHLDESIRLAQDTPGNKFRIMLRTLQADLINIGKTLTPVAISIAGGLTKMIDGLAKVKPLLIAFAGAIGTLLLTVGVIKVAGFAKSMYAPLGYLYKGTDKLWGMTSKIPGLGWTKNLAGGGQRFKDAATMNSRMTLKEAGDLLAKAGMSLNEAAISLKGAAGAELEAAEMGGVTGGGGVGGGSGRRGRFGRKARELKKLEQEALNELGGVGSRPYGPGGKRGLAGLFQKFGMAGRGAGQGIARGMIGGRNALLAGLLNFMPMTGTPRTGIGGESAYVIGNGRGRNWAKEKDNRAKSKRKWRADYESPLKKVEGIVENNISVPSKGGIFSKIVGKLSGKGLAGEAAKVAESSVIKDVEKKGLLTLGKSAITAVGEKVGGSVMMGLAGDAIGGMLGGPIGIAAMSILLPMAAPYIGKAFSGIAGMFRDKPGVVAAPTVIGSKQATITKKLTNQQAQLAKDELALSHAMATGGDTSNIMQWIARDKRNIQGLKTGMNNVNNKADFKKIYDTTGALTRVAENIRTHKNLSLADVAKLPKAIRDQMFGETNSNTLANLAKPGAKMSHSQREKIRGLLSYAGNQGMYTGKNQSSLANSRNAYNNYMMGAGGIGYLNQIDKGYVGRYKANKDIGGDILNRMPGWQKNQLKDWTAGKFSNNRETAKGQLFKAEQEAGILAKQSAAFNQAAKTTSSPLAKQQYLAEAKKLSAEAKKWQDVATKIDRKFKFDPGTIKDLATGIANANKDMYQSLGLTKQGYIDAFSAAISANGGGLANVVNKANGNATAYK
jgi:hypothetical protein